MDPYLIIIVAALAVIVSHMFNLLARRTNIPSVLMLIILGLALHQVLDRFGGFTPGPMIRQSLNVLGIVGLIMIVLEAALDLELSREKLPLIARSFTVALLTLLGTAAVIAFVIHTLTGEPLYRSLVYATPLAIVSSAIVLPSVSLLPTEQKEFMVYEATFSDILGIMLFYFLIADHGDDSGLQIAGSIGLSILITILVSVVASIAMIWVFQRIRTRIKFFLLFAVLLLLYALGKKMELSSLLIILVFGLMVSNHGLVFRKYLEKVVRPEIMENMEKELHLITGESAFLVRTFFFLVFGISIDITRLADPEVLLIGGVIIVVIYAVRSITVGLVQRGDLKTVTLVAPRGLITVLLAYNIPDHLKIPDRDGSILLMVILVTSLVMMLGLLTGGGKHDLSVAPEPDPLAFGAGTAVEPEEGT